MGAGAWFAAAWQSATDAARAAAAAIATGIVDAGDFIAECAVEAKEVTVEAFHRAADEVVAAAKWTAETTASVVRYAGAASAYLVNDAYNVIALATNPVGVGLLPVAPCIPCMLQALGRQKVTPSQAQTMLPKAQLANLVYKDSFPPKGATPPVPVPPPPEGYKMVDTEAKPSGMRAMTFEAPDGTLIVAFRGTRPSSMADVKADLAQHFGGVPAAYLDAAEYGGKAASRGPVEFVGHSLGGGEASYAAASTGQKATVFNPAPIGSGVRAELEADGLLDLANENVTNVSVVGDPVSDLFGVRGAGNGPLGETVWLSNPSPNPIARHGMDGVVNGLSTTAAR